MSFTKETLAHLWNKITNLVDTKLQKPKNDVAINNSSIGMSKKNLLNNTATTKVVPEGVTFTVNNDKSVTLSGTCTASTGIFLDIIYLEADTKYIISTNTLTAITFQLYEENMDTYIESIRFSQSTEFSVTESKKYALKLCASASKTYDDITVYPMIRYADITDGTYEQYTPDLQTQIDNINNNSGVNSSGVGLVKKNLLCPGTTTTRAGITYTVNYDGSVTLSGTNTSGTTYNYFSMPITLSPGKYKVNGMPSTSSITTYRTDIRSTSTGGTVYGHGISEFEVEFAETITVFYMIRIDGSYTESLDGVTFYPMIRHANIADSTYEPYVNDLLTQTMLNKATIGMTTSKKNFLKTVNPSSTLHGVRYTINSDGSILAKLTGEERTDTSYFVIDPSFNIPGDFILTSNIPIAYGRLEIYNENIGYVKQEHERPLHFTCDGITPIKVQIVLSPNAPITDGGFVIYPMITYKGVTNTKWEPYTKSIQEQINDILERLTILES